MGAEIVNINTEVAVSIGINLITIAFFAGVYFEAQKNMKLQIENLEKIFEMKVANLKEVLLGKIKELAEKQDKHNEVIERTYNLEKNVEVLQEQIKVENHRIEDLEEVQNECIRKGN